MSSSLPTVKYHEIESFQFQDKECPPTPVRVAYLDINPTASKTALIPTCFRGRLHTTQTFSTGALKDYRIIVVALFGNGESSSPSNMSPSSCPKKFDYRDCVHAQHDLLVSLGLLGEGKVLDMILGFSMGGQCAYYWTLMFPEKMRNAVVICSSAKTSGHNYQFLEGPKAAFEFSSSSSPSSPSSSGGGGSLRALGKAYSAWLTSWEWFEEERWRDLGFGSQGEWDEMVTGEGYDEWDGRDLLAMIGMWQRGDLGIFGEDGEGGKAGKEGDLARAMGWIRARVLVMPCRTDQYFRWEVSEREVKWIDQGKDEEKGRATLCVIPSVWGHLAGTGVWGEDKEWMDGRIGEFLAEGERGGELVSK